MRYFFGTDKELDLGTPYAIKLIINVNNFYTISGITMWNSTGEVEDSNPTTFPYNTSTP